MRIIKKRNISIIFCILILILILIFILFFIYYFINVSNNKIEHFTADNVTVVSGYWKIKNKHDNSFDEWFKNSLKINQKYIFFCDKSMNDYISQFRGDYETIFVDYPLNHFFTQQFAKDEWIELPNVPSKELGMIWNEKIHLLKLAKDMDPNPTEYYIWIDAGVAPYRHQMPPQNRLNIDLSMFPPNKLYYSQVNGVYHNFAATVLIISRNIIDEFHDKYYEILKDCNEVNCGSDQYVFTKMMKMYPDLFYKMFEDNDNGVGYGKNLVDLYSDIHLRETRS
jgi:hypothetical protein